jgi:hypothetical protein
LLAKVSSECLDLINDPESFIPGSSELFEKKFIKVIFEDLKLSKEMDSLMSRHGNGKNKPLKFFVSSRGKVRATILDHRTKARVSTPGLGTNDRIRQTNIAVGLLTAAEGNSVSPKPRKTTLTGMAKKTPTNSEIGSSCSFFNSQSFKNRFSACTQSYGFGRPFKVFFCPINWHQIIVDPAILDTVRSTYELEFTSPPIQYRIREPLGFHISNQKKSTPKLPPSWKKEHRTWSSRFPGSF